MPEEENPMFGSRYQQGQDEDEDIEAHNHLFFYQYFTSWGSEGEGGKGDTGVWMKQVASGGERGWGWGRKNFWRERDSYLHRGEFFGLLSASKTKKGSER